MREGMARMAVQTFGLKQAFLNFELEAILYLFRNRPPAPHKRFPSTVRL